jgi:ABC-type uncharacterized transport system substrate-binding protein
LTAGVLAAKQATSVIPIVFAAADDPLGTGLVGLMHRSERRAQMDDLSDHLGERDQLGAFKGSHPQAFQIASGSTQDNHIEEPAMAADKMVAFRGIFQPLE